MNKEGPSLEQMLHRIAATPPDFLAEPRIGNKGDVHVSAVMRDLLASKGHAIDLAQLSPLAGRDPKQDRNRLSIALLMSWLLADDMLGVDSASFDAVLALVSDDARQLATYTNAQQLFEDA